MYLSKNPHFTGFFTGFESLKALIYVLKEIIFRDSKRIYKPQKLSVSGVLFYSRLELSHNDSDCTVAWIKEANSEFIDRFRQNQILIERNYESAIDFILNQDFLL